MRYFCDQEYIVLWWRIIFYLFPWYEPALVLCRFLFCFLFKTPILHMVYFLMVEVLYLLPLSSLFLSTLVHSWLHIPVLHTSWEGVPLGVSRQRFLLPSGPWSLLAMRPPILDLFTMFLCLYFVLARKGFVWITQCMFLWLGYLLIMLACIVLPMLPFLLGDLVSCGGPVSFAVCHVCCFITVLPGVLLSISRKILEHKIHPSSQIVFYLWRGCQ